MVDVVALVDVENVLNAQARGRERGLDLIAQLFGLDSQNDGSHVNCSASLSWCACCRRALSAWKCGSHICSHMMSVAAQPHGCTVTPSLLRTRGSVEPLSRWIMTYLPGSG